MKNGSVEKAED